MKEMSLIRLSDGKKCPLSGFQMKEMCLVRLSDKRNVPIRLSDERNGGGLEEVIFMFCATVSLKRHPHQAFR